MPKNPYSAAAVRWSLIVLGLLGAIGGSIVAGSALMKGSASGCFTVRCISTRTWTAAADPTQFWFYVLFWLVLAILMGRMGWKEWRYR